MRNLDPTIWHDMLPFTALPDCDEATVEVKRSTGGKTDDPTRQLLARASVIDEQLDLCIDALHHSTASVSCWVPKPASRKTQTIVVLARERNNLRQIIEEIVDLARTHSSEAEVLKNRLAEAEKALLAARMPQRDDLVSDLQRQVQALQVDKSESQRTIMQLTRTRELTSARLRDLTSEYQGIAEKAELELRRLESEVAKIEETRDAAIVESLEKSREMKSLQKRYDNLKSIAESHREAVAAAKKQAEETAANHARALELHTRRVAEARTGREAAVAELETLRREHNVLHDAFVQAGAVEHQLTLLRKANFLSSGSSSGSSTSAATTSNAPGGSGGRTVVRNLLKVREGWCVHARPCSSAASATGSDTSKLSPLPYDSLATLEATIQRQGLFLCNTCLANGGFRTL